MARWTRSSKVQSILLARADFTREQAREWAERNDFRWSRIEATRNYWRLVQAPACACTRGTIRTITMSEARAVKATVCLPRRGVAFTPRAACKRR